MKPTSHKNGFKIPENYFEAFPDRLMEKVRKGTARASDHKGGFKVPEGYFEAFPHRLSERIRQGETPVRNLWPKRSAWIAAAAAVAAFMLLFPSGKNGDLQFEDLTRETLAEYLQADAFDLSAYELAESLPLEQIAMEDVMDQVPEDQQIIDYLESHTDADEEFYWDRDE